MQPAQVSKTFKQTAKAYSRFQACGWRSLKRDQRLSTHPLQDKLKILDTLAVLLERHGATVININDYIVKSEPDNIICNLSLDAPSLTEAIDLLSRPSCDLA